MDSSNRQSEILEKLARIRKELARKERKLQKLKRLSAQKKRQGSLQNESIGSDETRLSSSADICSPLRVPLETTLPESEVCHSKSQQAKTPEERSLPSREADSTLRADSSDSHKRRLQTNRGSSSVCRPSTTAERETAPANEANELGVAVASPRRKSSRLGSLHDRMKSQRETIASDVTQPSIENIDTANFSDPLETNSHLSVPVENYADAPQDTNENKAAECNPDPKAHSCKVSMQTNACVDVSRLDNAAFLDMLLQDSQPEVKDSNATTAVRSPQQDKVTLSTEKSSRAAESRFLQGEKTRCSVTSGTTAQQNETKRSTGLSLAKWTKEGNRKQSSSKGTNDVAKCETNIVSGDKVYVEVLNSCDDGDSRDSQQELFVEDETGSNVEDVHLKEVVAGDRDGLTQQSAKEGTETTEQQCDNAKPPVPFESQSPVRKKRRTRSHEPTAMLADAKDTNYNFRKRKLSYSPFWKKRMGRESKTIACTFNKLIQGALEMPVSMFQLNFEKYGLLECVEAKGLPTDPDSDDHREQSCLTADSNMSPESTSRKSELSPEMKPNKRASAGNHRESRTLDNSKSSMLAGQTVVSSKENVVDKLQSVTLPENKVARRSSRRQRRSTDGEATASEPSASDATSVPDKRYATRRTKASSLLAVCDTVGSTAPVSNGNSESVVGALPLQSSGNHTVQASQHGETQKNGSQSQIGASCVLPHIARDSCEVLTPVLSSNARTKGGACEQERQQSMPQHGSKTVLSLSSHSVTRRSKMGGSGKPEHVLRDVSSEDATDTRGHVTQSHAIPVTPRSDDPTSLVDMQGSSELPEQTPPLSSRLSCRGGEKSSQEPEDMDASTSLRGEVVEYFAQDDCNAQGGGQASEVYCTTAVTHNVSSVASSVLSGALFSQSEENGSANDIKDFVIGVVERLGVADGNLPGLPSAAAEVPQEDSETPDELNLPEVFIAASRASLGDQSAPACHSDQCSTRAKTGDDRLESRRDTEGAEEESTTLLASLLACSGVSNAEEQSSDVPAPATKPPSCGLADECRSASKEKYVDSHPTPSLICPSPAKRVPSEESELQCTVSRRPVAKRLFADPAANSRLASVADSEPQELMDPRELEGMFDEWSEEYNLDGACVPAVRRDSRSGTQGLKGGRHGDKPSACGRGSIEEAGSQSRSSDGVDGSRIKLGEEGPSDGGERGKSTERDSKGCNLGSQNQCPTRTDLKLRRSPAKPIAETAEEETMAEGDQCSESLSSSLQPLSGLSNFTEEEVGDGELAACSVSERQSEPQDVGSPVLRLSRSEESWCDEDCDGADQDCADAVDEEEGCVTFSDRSLALGTKRPLLFFCALKCATKQPVTRVYVVRATPRPFLVSVQVGAVNVWHLERTWRHTLVAGNIKFPVEEVGGEQQCLLLRCEGWSVLVYLSPRAAPLQLPCLRWATRDGRRCCQLLLTLGGSTAATNAEEDFTTKGGLCIYRLAQLSGRGEGRFASALKTANGATLLRVHRVRCHRGEFGDETEFLGRTSNLLDSLVQVEGLPDALLGNHANLFYVWDCENRVLVKKMVHEPDLFADLRRISWCCSDRGLLFALMRSSDDVTSTLVAVNPFSCKAEPVCSASWKPAARARVGDSRPCGVQVEGRHVACVGPGYGVRIWNLFTGNPVADMRYQSSTSVAVAHLSDFAIVAVGSDDGRVLVFTC